MSWDGVTPRRHVEEMIGYARELEAEKEAFRPKESMIGGRTVTDPHPLAVRLAAAQGEAMRMIVAHGLAALTTAVENLEYTIKERQG